MPPNSKTLDTLNNLLTLRYLVGFLGGKKVHGWWDCFFLDELGIRFLATTFPRSAQQAALNATVDAAQRLHDESIGRIGTFHLFRLPAEVEERMETLEQLPVKDLNRDAAMQQLAQLADASIIAPEGPVQVGVEERIVTENSIRELAAHYLSAFKQGIHCYPYFGAHR